MTEFVRPTQPWNFQEVRQLLENMENQRPIEIFDRQQFDSLGGRAVNEVSQDDLPDALQGVGETVSFTASTWLDTDIIRNAFSQDKDVLGVMDYLRGENLGYILRERFIEARQLIAIFEVDPMIDKTKVLASTFALSDRYKEHRQSRLELASAFWLLDQRGVRVQG